MFNNKEQLKSLSTAIVHLVYRNTEVEDYHSQSVVMDEKFYQTVTKIVSDKLKPVVKFYNQLMAVSIEDVQRAIKGEKTEISFELLCFLNELSFNLMFGTQWDSPVQLDELPQGDLVDYILNGHFKQSCAEHRELDDETMCFINKDINNRVYTLLVNGYFEQM